MFPITKITISFFSPEKIFSQYDIIFIPQWVWVEVCDSDNRKSYIADLKEYSRPYDNEIEKIKN